MGLAKSFKDKSFVVADPDARIRRDDDLMAFDTATGAGGRIQTVADGTRGHFKNDGNPTCEWLKRHATGFGFVRAVSGELLHWELDEARAQAALAAGTFKTPNVAS